MSADVQKMLADAITIVVDAVEADEMDRAERGLVLTFALDAYTKREEARP